jgi:signal transduction histidine kinase
MAQLENDRIALISAPFYVTDILNDVIQQATPLAEDKGLCIQSDTAGIVTNRVQGDAEKITQILFNLVHNSIKFSDAGCITIKAEKFRDDEWLFSVKDQGMGIPKERQKTIFDPFEQASKSLTNRQRGVGLGLSIVKQFVELMDGRVEVISQEDIGSTFTIWLTLPPVTESELI